MAMKPVKALVAVIVGLLGVGIAAPASAAPDPAEPIGIARVAAIYPLTTPELRTALIDADTLAAYTAPSGHLTRELSAVIDAPLAIGIDPMILASIRVLGNAAPPSAISWLERLASASNETFSLSYADSDLTLGLQAGSPAALAPTTFDFAIDPSHFAEEAPPTAAATGDPSEQPDPEEPPQLPTNESLVAWDFTLPAVAWPVADSVVSSDIPALAASGYTTTILNSANVDRSSAAKARATVADATSIVTDDSLSSSLVAASNAASNEEWGASVAQLLAGVDATAAGGGTEGATMVVAFDRESLGFAPRLASTLGALDALPSTDMASLSSVAASAPSEATLIDSPQTPERIAAAQSLLASEASDASFSTVAENPTLITAERRLRLLATMSTAWNSYPGGWGAAVSAYLKESEDLHESVGIVQSSDINLLADRASLPVTVSNALDQPVTVFVTVTARSPILEIEEVSVPLTIEPDSQRRSQIPVQSLSNGSAQISVTIASVAAVPIGQPTSVQINVYAGWETPITVAIGVI
ncbi:MAG: hypothetical protein JWM51_617, partial [Microbacteriaceae bacterium]|nr:hypothetical protein [Microbacteriaceae bacterium]